MTTITGQSRIHDMFVRSTRPAAEAESEDQTKDAIKASVANKADVIVSKVVGGTAISSTVATGDATGAAVEAAKVAAKTIAKNPVVADGLAKGATVVSGAVAAAKGDHFAAAATAKSVLQNSPSLSKLTVVADAVLLATGDKKIEETIQEVKKEAKKVVSPTATTGDRVKSGLKLAQHTQSGVILGQQLAGAADDVLAWIGKFPAFSGIVKGLGRVGKALAASPLGALVKKLGKLMPVLNLAALANSVRIAIDIWRDPRSSATSKVLVAGSIASGAVLFGASVATGGAALVPAAAAFGVATELGLMATRKRDLEVGNTDRQMAHYLSNPIEGLRAMGRLVGETADGIAQDVGDVFRKLGAKLTGRAPAPKKATSPSGMLGAVPKFE